MNGLIKVESSVIAGTDVQTVDARELHAFLEVGRDFTTWIKERVEKYGFQEGADYTTFDSPDLGNQSGRGGDRRSKTYAITLDMAKELAMVENNDKGREARRYFIECERRARQPQFQIPQTLPDALRLAADLADQNKRLEGKVAEQAPKVEAHDRLMDAEGTLTLREAAKAIEVPERKFIQGLQSRSWIFKPHGSGAWLGYSDKVKAGLLTHKIHIAPRPDGTEKVCEQVRITPLGVTKLLSMFQGAPV